MTNRRGRGLSVDEKLIKPKYRAGVVPTEAPNRVDSVAPRAECFPRSRIPRPSPRLARASSRRITDARTKTERSPSRSFSPLDLSK